MERVRTVPKSPTQIGAPLKRWKTIFFVYQDLQKFFVLHIYKVKAELNLSR
jgi:hypothetical protein